MASVLYSIVLDSDTSKINCTFAQPIHLNLQKYRYYLKLLSVSFSNVFGNVENNLYVNGFLMASPGIYDITGLIDAYNHMNFGKMGLNTNTGRLYIENDGGTTITISTSNFLDSDLGGKFALPITLNPGDVVYSSQVPIIQSYNYFILTSQSIHNNAFQNRVNPSVMTSTNILYAFSSAMAPFKYKNWVAVEPVEFEIRQNTLNTLDFELRTGNDEELETKAIGNTDFNIHCQIIAIEK